MEAQSARVTESSQAVTREPDEDVMCLNGHRLPTLFVLGAQKCATTSVARRLFEAPSTFSPAKPFRDGGWFSSSKELHFFETHARWRRGLSYYATAFPNA